MTTKVEVWPPKLVWTVDPSIKPNWLRLYPSITGWECCARRQSLGICDIPVLRTAPETRLLLFPARVSIAAGQSQSGQQRVSGEASGRASRIVDPGTLSEDRGDLVSLTMGGVSSFKPLYESRQEAYAIVEEIRDNRHSSPLRCTCFHVQKIHRFTYVLPFRMAIS